MRACGTAFAFTRLLPRPCATELAGVPGRAHDWGGRLSNDYVWPCECYEATGHGDWCVAHPARYRGPLYLTHTTCCVRLGWASVWFCPSTTGAGAGHAAWPTHLLGELEEAHLAREAQLPGHLLEIQKVAKAAKGTGAQRRALRVGRRKVIGPGSSAARPPPGSP